MIDPDRIRTNTLPPPVVIEQVLVDRRVAPAAEDARARSPDAATSSSTTPGSRSWIPTA